jgi:phosphoribosylformylglycinamidine synthase subunit PurQ / glutaminase
LPDCRQETERMSKPRVLVLRAAGVNCDAETAHAFELAGGAPERVHVNRLAEGAVKLSEYDILAIPGGFSYGDDVASGKILAVEIMGRLGDALRKFVDDGKPVIGICNGFQVLVKAGLLPGFKRSQEATLTTNDSGKFEDRWVWMAAAGKKSPCIWTKGIDLITLPVAHGEGKFIAPPKVMKRIDAEGLVVFRYVMPDGKPAEYPYNPNGSVDGIAAVTDRTGRIFGLMPHPERHVASWQHPRWTRRKEQPAEGEGLAVFRNAVTYVK